MEKKRKENLWRGRCKFKSGYEALQRRIQNVARSDLFVAARDGCLSFLHINPHRCLAQPRKGDQPPVVYPEGSAAVVSWWLLPIHRFSDHTALQQGCGMDHLLQARVSVPLTGVLSLNTHTLLDSYIFHAQSDPICTQPVDQLLSHGASTQVVFSLIYFSAPLLPAFLPSPSAY